jgi:glycine/D-amino acid oxidase-like deaminating enzyme
MKEKFMDLYSGVEYWLTQNGTVKQWPVLNQDIHCDVVIIGAGVSGVLTAWYLTEAGVETVVLDRRFVGGGSTAASTALLLYETDKSLNELIEMRGEKTAVRAWHLFREAIQKIGDIVTYLNDDCEFAWKSAYYLASTKHDGKLLQKEYEVRRKYGFEMSFLSRQDLKQATSFNREAALLTPDAGQIDPYRFSHELIEQAVKKGLKVYEQTAVVDYQTTKTGVSLRTDQGWSISSKNVIFASGYETQQYLQRDIISRSRNSSLISS